MQRTNYWNQTRPTDTQLQWTETSKINAINQRLRSSAQMGISWGFQVTVNSTDNTKIDVARGEGYSGGMFLINEFETAESGQRISTYTDTPSGTDDTGPAATSQALADYTAGVKNYVSLVYRESTAYPLAERAFPFTVRQTVVTEGFYVSVLTETQWNLLDSEERNKRVLVGIVTAQGAGTALTAADIDQFVQPKTLPTTTQPSALSGVTVVGIADVTPLGIGTLRWETSTNMIYWTAPGDTEGTGLSISDSGVFTVYSNNPNYYIELNIVWGSLSLVAVETSENISVRSLYGRSIPMFSAVDQIHRDMIGSGQPSETNPHALTLADIGGGTLDHADLFHVNGISKDADTSQLECQIDAINDRIQVTSLGGYENSFLVDGVTLTEVSGSPYVNFDTTPAPTTGEYLIYIDSGGNLDKVQIGSDLWDTDIYIVDMKNTVAGTGTITWTAASASLTYQAPDDGSAGAAVYVMGDNPSDDPSGYYKLYSSNTDNWVIVRVVGALGGNNSSTITIVKDETDYADESMLKLAVVNWNSGTETLSNLRDIRSFVTADNRTETEEEHDADGRHTKVLQQELRVNVGTNNDAIFGSASLRGVVGEATSIIGVYGEAPNSGIYGYAATHNGVVGSAETNDGVKGLANSQFGVYGSAETCGVKGEASVDTGVFGWAPYGDTGVKGQATGLYGVYAIASGTGVYGSASSTGIYGHGNLIYGGYFTASNTGIYGTAGALYGLYAKASESAIYGSASNTAIYAIVSGNTAVYGSAVSRAIYGVANSKIGVYGSASVTGGDFAASNTAIKGEAPGVIGGYLQASATGIYGYAEVDTAIYARAGGDIGVYAIASSDTGVYGEADASGGAFSANAGNYGVWAQAATNYGAYGHAAGATGVFGSAEDSVGVYGYCGTLGVWGSADYTAVYGTADENYGGKFGASGGAGTAVWMEGLLRYDIGTQAATDGTATAYSPAFYLPIIVVTGTATNSHAIAIYDTQ